MQETLADRSCVSGKDGPGRLSREEVGSYLRQLDPAWALDEKAGAIERRFDVKGFAKAVYLANLAVFVADREGHHPDIAFGFGYCRVRYTTHDVDGLSENDFICAAKLDRLLG